MRELWRMFLWGMAAAVALIIAVYAGSTDAGVDRARHAALQLREVYGLDTAVIRRIQDKSYIIE